FFFFSSRRRHTRFSRDWSSDVCSSDLNLLETLLKLNQTVVGLDNFATGHQHNLDEVQSLVTAEQWAKFRFIEGDIREFSDCQNRSEERRVGKECRYRWWSDDG